MQKIDRILISADMLRPRIVGNSIEYFHKSRLDKYYYSLVYQIQEAVCVPVEKFSFSNTDFDFHKFYSLCNIPLKDVNSWLKIYNLENIPKEAVEYYQKYIDKSLVIYHEAPNVIKRIHEILNVPYIDLNVHPIRFLPDNFWGMLTNEPKIFDRIKKYQIDDREFYIYANLIKAHVKGKQQREIIPNSLLFTGQTNIDKSLYYDNRVMTIFDFEDEIRELGKKYSKVYYKAHPYCAEIENIYKFLKQFNFVEVIEENFYKLCSNENLSAVASITSGTLYEAKYFGKKSHFLAKEYLKFNYDKNCQYDKNTTLSLYHDFLLPQFWADVLQDITDIKDNVPHLKLLFRSNEIRNAFSDYWGQTELDPCVNINNKYRELL